MDKEKLDEVRRKRQGKIGASELFQSKFQTKTHYSTPLFSLFLFLLPFPCSFFFSDKTPTKSPAKTLKVKSASPISPNSPSLSSSDDSSDSSSLDSSPSSSSSDSSSDSPGPSPSTPSPSSSPSSPSSSSPSSPSSPSQFGDRVYRNPRSGGGRQSYYRKQQ